ncbi:MAG: hypothetical protein E6Q97_19830 [Desulfurellales bacterium]|nr:MAG: hypothetical protein E6Q97_19830 [Desulfurellales bacterium]
MAGDRAVKGLALRRVLNALLGAYVELDAAMGTYEDYVPSGKLLDEMERAIQELQAELAREETR